MLISRNQALRLLTFILKKESIEGIEFSDDADSLLEQLRSFGIENIKIENCVLRKSLIRKFFQIKSSQIMWFEKWIFWNKKGKKITDWEEQYDKELIFDNWKYTDEDVEDENSIDWNKIKNDQCAEWIVYYFNIKVMHKILKQLRLKSSFGFNTKIYTKKELDHIISNKKDELIYDSFKWSYEKEDFNKITFKKVVKESKSEIINKCNNILIKTSKAYCNKTMEYNR